MIIKNIPWLPFGWKGMAFSPFIFIKKGYDIQWLIRHEQYHLRQQKDHGFFRYMWKYASSGNFRVGIELSAYLNDGAHSKEDAYKMASQYRNILFGRKK